MISKPFFTYFFSPIYPKGPRLKGFGEPRPRPFTNHVDRYFDYEPEYFLYCLIITVLIYTIVNYKNLTKKNSTSNRNNKISETIPTRENIDKKEFEEVFEKNDVKSSSKEMKKKKLSDYLDSLKYGLKLHTDVKKGDLYDLNYWFDQVTIRVDSHDIWYSKLRTSNIEDQIELANNHYDEYHHRMIEEENKDKLIFIIPRVECFLEIYKLLKQIKQENLIEEDVELFNRYLFHSKTSLYGAVIFLFKDVESGIENLNKIFPDFDKKFIDDYEEKSLDNSEIINKLNDSIRAHFNVHLISYAEKIIIKKNTSFYKNLIKLINNIFPKDSELIPNEEDIKKEVLELPAESYALLGRCFSALKAFCKMQSSSSYHKKDDPNNDFEKFSSYLKKVCKDYKIETEIFSEDLNKMVQEGEDFLRKIDNNGSDIDKKENTKRDVAVEDVVDQYKTDDNLPETMNIKPGSPKMFKKDITGLMAYFKEMKNMERIFNEMTGAIRNGYTVKKYLTDANLMNDPEIREIAARGFSDVAGFLKNMLEIRQNSELQKDYDACVEAAGILRK